MLSGGEVDAAEDGVDGLLQGPEQLQRRGRLVHRDDEGQVFDVLFAQSLHLMFFPFPLLPAFPPARPSCLSFLQRRAFLTGAW